MTTGIDNYLALLQMFPPRPIVTAAQYDETVAQINQLIDKPNLTPEEQDFMTLLGTLVMAYEDEHYPDEEFESRGVEFLNGLITLNGVEESTLLPIFQTQANTQAVLSGERTMTAEQIHQLATLFQVPHDLFFESVFAGG